MSSKSRFSLPVVTSSASSDAPGCRDAAEPHPDEFARGASVWDNRLNRRQFLATSAASFALAGLTGCTDRPNEPIVPYVDPPEQITAGEPQFFATTLTLNGYGRGVIVTTREGRPVKIEGNPDHPASLGAADAQMQAAILGLYDPLRSKYVTYAGRPSGWAAFETALLERMHSHEADAGDGLAILTGDMSSPTVTAQVSALKSRFPKSKWHAYDPIGRYSALEGSGIAFGQLSDVTYDISKSDVIVSFDSDFLIDEPGSLAYARDFANGRRPTAARPMMNRLYVAEADFTLTGAQADHRLPAAPGRVGRLLLALATQMEVGDAPTPTDLSPPEAEWLAAVSSDLHAHRGRCLILVGDSQPATIHATALALNQALGNVGQTVRPIGRVLTNPATFDPGSAANHEPPLLALQADIRAGLCRTLLILGQNIVRHGPADFDLASALAQMSQRDDAFTAHLGLYADETAFSCQWHVPAQHELETWSDVRAFDGTASLVQPMIAPLTSGKSPIDLMNVMIGRSERSAYDTVRDHWRAKAVSQATFEDDWARALRQGVIDQTAFSVQPFQAKPPKITVAPATGGLTAVFRPDPSIGDGSFYHNAWLQELPRPLTKIVWGNAALMSPSTAIRHGVQDGAVVRLRMNDRAVELPALVVPGVAEDVVVLHLGYGPHKVVGMAADDDHGVYGVDVYPLRTSRTRGFAENVVLELTGRFSEIVRTHNHHAMAADVSADPSVRKSLTPQVIATPATPPDELELHNRKLIRTATVGQFFESPDFAAKMDEAEIKQLYPSWDYSTGPQWGMTIDLTTCIGCNACITACQAENNTPSVGPEQVARSREMHWLRVDSYFDDIGRVHHQPVACMQCENAPCEYVCPVGATTHSTDGLNQMTYNRCVGTRYCSNNCPYKVRRFNFFDYTSNQPESYAMQHNPDVTVRTRGVMEKCTYCVQRINYATRKTEIAEVNAAADGNGDTTQLRRDMIGRLQTACQQTCPTQAISFGDLTDPKSAVTQHKHDPRNYGLLTELSTKPRTTYLASITNPNPTFGGKA